MKTIKKCVLALSFMFLMTTVLASAVTISKADVGDLEFTGSIYKMKEDGSDYDRTTPFGTVKVMITDHGEGTVTGIQTGEYGGGTIDDVNTSSMPKDSDYDNVVEYGVSLVGEGYTSDYTIRCKVTVPVLVGYAGNSAKVYSETLSAYTSEGVVYNGDGTITVEVEGTSMGAVFYIEYKKITAFDKKIIVNNVAKTVSVEDTGETAYASDVTTGADKYMTVDEIKAAIESAHKESWQKAEAANKVAWDADQNARKAEDSSYQIVEYVGEEYSNIDFSLIDFTSEEYTKIEGIKTIKFEKIASFSYENENIIKNVDVNIILNKTSVYPKPTILDGEKCSITEGEGSSITIRSSANYSDFLRVELDDQVVDPSNYTTKEGSTIVILNPEYVAKLSAGEHIINIVSKSGTANAILTVQAKSSTNTQVNKTETPNTGDTTSLYIWAILMSSAILLFGTTFMYKKIR